jgi:hypothetical protein
MSVWTERIENSGARTRVKRVRELVDAGGASDPVEQEHLDRTGRIATQVDWVLDNVDPALIGGDAVNTLVQGLTAAVQHLEAWQAGNGPEYLLTQTMTAVDQVIDGLGLIPMPASAAEASAEISSLRRSLGQYRGQMEREVKALKGTVEKAVADLQAQKDTAVADLVNQGAEAVSEVATLREEVTRVRDEVTTLLTSARTLETNQQTAFTTAQTANQEAFAKLLGESRETLTASTQKMQADLRAAVQAVDTEMNAYLEEASARKAGIDKLFEIAAETSLIGSYTRNATRERGAANLWRRVAVAAAAVAAAIGLWAAIVAAGSGTDWDLLAAKALLLAGVTGVAAYAAGQSSEHRNAERDAEHVAVQLATLKPYLADLSQDTERDRLLIEIAQKLFGQARSAGKDNGDVAKLLSEDPRLLSTLLAALQAAAKK